MINDIYIRRTLTQSNTAIIKRALSLLLPNKFKKQGRAKIRLNDLINTLARRDSVLPQHNPFKHTIEGPQAILVPDDILNEMKVTQEEVLGVVRVHASGAAISRAIQVACQLEKRDPYRIFIAHTDTSSASTRDHISTIPQDPDNNCETVDGGEERDRNVSCIHITIISLKEPRLTKSKK